MKETYKGFSFLPNFSLRKNGEIANSYFYVNKESGQKIDFREVETFENLSFGFDVGYSFVSPNNYAKPYIGFNSNGSFVFGINGGFLF